MILDAKQSDAVGAIVAGDSLSVVGAAGSGKTTILKSAVREIISREPGARIAVVSPDRRAATDLRNHISMEVGALGEGVVIQSVAAFAFSIVSSFAQAVGRREPELMSGPEQDAMIRDIFALGARGVIPSLSAALGEQTELAELPAFRSEYRDLLTRSAELGLSSTQLRELGLTYGIDSWVTGAHVMEAYEGALATAASSGHGNPDRTDHARLVRSAAWIIENWSEAIEKSPVLGQLGISKPSWDFVLVDDVQNATLSLVGLLLALKRDGASVSAFGDPDLAVQGFRGGVAHLPALLARQESVGGIGAKLFHLEGSYRMGRQIRQLSSKISSGIHVAGTAKHRHPHDDVIADGDGAVSESAVTDGPETANEGEVSALAFANEEDQYAHVAAMMRRRHLVDGVGYADMAVITRSHAGHESLRRTFSEYGIPVQPVYSSRPLREQRAVHALLSLIKLSMADPVEVDVQDLREVLTGPLFDIDTVELRGAMRQLRGWELKRGGHRSDDELLLELLDLGASDVGNRVDSFVEFRSVLARIRRAVGSSALAEMVLWETWEGVGVAQSWRNQALGSGAQSDSANADLDAVMQVFRLAQRMADRDATNASILDLIELLESQDVPEDSIARAGSRDNEISLATPSSTIGRSWTDVYVLDVNEGTWPNTKLRNPLTRVADLAGSVIATALSGQPQAPQQSFADVIDDELRMLNQAVTRATHTATLTCVHSEEVKPSRFIDWLFISEAERGDLQKLNASDPLFRLHEVTQVERIAHGLDLSQLIGELRQAADSDNDDLRLAAERHLEKLAEKGVRAADPRNWVDSYSYSSEEVQPFSQVTVSPSGAGTALSCPLRAFLEKAKIRSTKDNAAADRGTLVHQIAEEIPSGDLAKMRARLDELWAEYGFGEGYFDQQSKKQTEDMIERLSVYLKNASKNSQAELWGKKSLEGVDVIARIDRIDRSSTDPGRVKIIDFKTGQSIPSVSDVESDPQLMIYQWLAANEGIDTGRGNTDVTSSDGAELVFVSKGSGKPTIRTQEPLDADQQAFAAQVIKTVGEYYRGPEYPARKSDNLCRHCEFASLCPVQSGERIFS